MNTSKFFILSLFYCFLFGAVSYAQITPRLPAADTIYVYNVINNDTLKRVLSKRLFHIYDKQGHIREVLLEKRKNNDWEYEKRMIFSYNAINRLQIIKQELWDSTDRDWLKFKKRTFAYNIRHLPIEYTDERWNETEKLYKASEKTTLTYNKKNQPFQAIHKVFRRDKWTDSLRKTLIYDTAGTLIGLEQRKNSRDTWIAQFLWEYKYEKNTIKEILQKDAIDGKNLEIISKEIFSFNYKQELVGKKMLYLVAQNKPLIEKKSMRAWFNQKKNQWTYTFYQIENNKTLISEQWVLCPSSENTQTLLPNFPFPLELEW